MHLALLGSLLAPALLRATAQDEPLAQIELVMQDTPTVGAGHAASAPPPKPAQPTPAQPAAPVPPPVKQAAEPTPAPPAPAAPPSPPEAPPGAPEQAGTGLVTGSQVIPANADDPKNAPPPYPDAAARLGEQGTVGLLIQITPDGLPVSVEITRSSGHEILDRAAREAVLAWHFRPAVRNGAPVASQLPFNVRYLMHPPGDPLWSGSTP